MRPVAHVRMKGKNAAPRWKQVCVDCLHWLADDELVDHVLDLESDDDSEVFSC